MSSGMVKTIARTLLITAACLHIACKPALDADVDSANQAVSRHILHVLRLASEQSPLLKGDLSEGNPYKIFDQSNTRDETCERRHEQYVWAIETLTEDLITLVLCDVFDHHVHVRSYDKKNGLWLILVASQRGAHGGTWYFEFFDFDPNLNMLTPRTEKSLGLSLPRENEFLNKQQKLRPLENHVAFFHLNEDGTIEASPSTWMEKRWENRSVAFRIIFKWNGSSFSKTVTKWEF